MRIQADLNSLHKLTVQQLKELGNKCFSTKDYDDAIKVGSFHRKNRIIDRKYFLIEIFTYNSLEIIKVAFFGASSIYFMTDFFLQISIFFIFTNFS